MILILHSFLPPPSQSQHLLNKLLQEMPVLTEETLSYKRIEDQLSHLIGKSLIQKGLNLLGQSHYPLDSIQVTTNKRPFIPSSTIDFNVSHASQCVVLGITTHGRLGIDVEYIKEITLTDFAGQMTSDELHRVSRSDHPLTEFYRYWTEKESVLKASGDGLMIPLKSFTVADNKALLKGIEWHVREIFIAKDYICNLATDSPAPDLKIEIMPINLF